MHTTLLRLPAVKARTGLCRSAIYAGMKAGTFPKSVRISERCIAWPDAAIEKWIAERAAAMPAGLQSRRKGGK